MNVIEVAIDHVNIDALRARILPNVLEHTRPNCINEQGLVIRG